MPPQPLAAPPPRSNPPPRPVPPLPDPDRDAAATGLRRSVSWQVLSTVFLTFLCYLTIGLPLAILPSFVHGDLGYGSVVAGLVISVQYLATLASRPMAGRMADTVGPKRAVLIGLAACAASGALLSAGALLSRLPGFSLGCLVASRLLLGVAESGVGTGAIAWAIGRVGPAHTARVISWSGIATYGAIAAGAPLGVALWRQLGLPAIGALVVLLGALGMAIALSKPASAVPRGRRTPFHHVFLRVLPHGLALALGSIGFGSLATFITLFYAGHRWPGAAVSLSVFGTFFILSRLAFGRLIGRLGGFPVAFVSLLVEALGLGLLWSAGLPRVARAGAALTGVGFGLVFPALGVEAVGRLPAQDRGAALGAFTVFLDVALGVTGPLAGGFATRFGFPAIFALAAFAAALGAALTAALHRMGRTAARV